MKNYNYFQYFTIKKYWRKKQVLNFIYKYRKNALIDPFAGNGDLLNSFYDNKNRKKIGYDIDKNMNWKINDSLNKIPFHKNGFIVTNPPYLSRVSNKRNNINHPSFLNSNRSDLYQVALDKIIESKLPGIAIIPETFINSKFSKKHIYSITILIPNPFKDTETPICIICFDPNKIFKKTIIYKNSKKIGFLEDIINIRKKILSYKKVFKIKFNEPNGKLSLIGFDSSNGKRIHFLNSNDLKYKKNIKKSSRVITKIKIKDINITKNIIKKLNDKLKYYRNETKDILLSPFKGNIKNNSKRRRRLDFKTARDIINSILSNLKLEKINQHFKKN